MLFSEAIYLLKNDETINGIINNNGKRIIIDRNTSQIYSGDGNIFFPNYDDLVDESWELER